MELKLIAASNVPTPSDGSAYPMFRDSEQDGLVVIKNQDGETVAVEGILGGSNMTEVDAVANGDINDAGSLNYGLNFVTQA